MMGSGRKKGVAWVLLFSPHHHILQPHLGDVSRGQLLTIKNFYELMNGIITPVQMEGLRLLLTPFPQEEFTRLKTGRWPARAWG